MMDALLIWRPVIELTAEIIGGNDSLGLRYPCILAVPKFSARPLFGDRESGKGIQKMIWETPHSQ
jgi:hypothetical protein